MSEAHNKVRPVIEGSSFTVASVFREIARETFSFEEVRRWNKRDEFEADAHFKRAMSEVFCHELSRLAAKNVRINHLEQSLDKAAAIEASLRDELVAVQTKAKKEVTAHRK